MFIASTDTSLPRSALRRVQIYTIYCYIIRSPCISVPCMQRVAGVKKPRKVQFSDVSSGGAPVHVSYFPGRKFARKMCGVRCTGAAAPTRNAYAGPTRSPYLGSVESYTEFNLPFTSALINIYAFSSGRACTGCT